MKRSLLAIVGLMIILCLTMGLRAQDEHPTCELPGNAGGQLESVGETILELAALGVPEADVAKLWSAFSAVESCNDAFGCSLEKVSVCTQPLRVAAGEINTDDLTEDAASSVAFVGRGLNFVDSFAAQDLAATIGGTDPPVPGPNCTATIKVLPDGSSLPFVSNSTPVLDQGGVLLRFVETDLPEGAYLWSVLGAGEPIGSSSEIVGTKTARMMTMYAQRCLRGNYPPGCEMSVSVVKTVDGKQCRDFHVFYVAAEDSTD